MREMMMGPTTITEIADFQLDVLISQGTSFVHIFFFDLLFSIFVF